jgi:hypothetical protein
VPGIGQERSDAVAAYRGLMASADWAETVARLLLADPLPRRWAHTQGVAATARTLSGILGDDAEMVVAAAWLHDIGYAPALASTGFHPLDGARHLRDTEHAADLLCCLVAHHSGALPGAREAGLADDLVSEFPPPPDDLLDALTFADMTTGPDGQAMPADERLAEIVARYGPGHPVTRVMTDFTPEVTAVVSRVTRRLASS